MGSPALLRDWVYGELAEYDGERDTSDRRRTFGERVANRVALTDRIVAEVNRRTASPVAPPESPRLPPSGMCSCDGAGALRCGLRLLIPCPCNCHAATPGTAPTPPGEPGSGYELKVTLTSTGDPAGRIGPPRAALALRRRWLKAEVEPP